MDCGKPAKEVKRKIAVKIREIIRMPPIARGSPSLQNRLSRHDETYGVEMYLRLMGLLHP
jgi:hypothetical protein